MLELERNSPIEAEALSEFFSRCGWQEDDAAPKLEWALAASDEWVVCRLDGQLVGFGRSCRLGPLKRVVFDVVVDPRLRDSGLKGAIVRLLTENAGRLEDVAVFSEPQAGLLGFPSAKGEDAGAGGASAAPARPYLGRGYPAAGDGE
ncbi:MAG: GNAT family N-acetyltransferase [Thermoleophilia bacterium]|nr:GNAT family N-acetyltransferase [Thermoleophilia bacterium]